MTLKHFCSGIVFTFVCGYSAICNPQSTESKQQPIPSLPAGCQPLLNGTAGPDKQLKTFVNAVLKDSKNHRQAEEQAKECAIFVLQYYFPRPTPTLPPIKVRGGSMTARSSISGNGGWVAGPSSTFCTTADATKASIRDHNDTLIPFTLPGPGWKMKFYGRSSDGNNSSGRGFQIENKMNACGGSSGTTLALSLFDENGTNQSAFFPDDDTTDADGVTQKRRFRDMNSECVGPNGPPASGSTATTVSGDEDMCERMYQVVLLDSSGNQTGQKTCRNGECIVFIGK